jgi:hypothetical protein
MAAAMDADDPSPASDDDPIPLFGTWPRIYTAVVVCALAVMALVAVFSSFPY